MRANKIRDEKDEFKMDTVEAFMSANNILIKKFESPISWALALNL